MWTEQEARTKWCSEARTGVTAGAAGLGANRHVDPSVVETETRCLASGCMHWRWTSKLTVDRPDGINAIGGQRVKREQGYCGLSGRP